MKYLVFLFTWLASILQTSPAVTKRYEHEFCGRNGARITLSTGYPRYFCELSEPLQSHDFNEFIRWRADCVSDFEKLSGVKIPEGAFGNESVRMAPAPAPRNRR